jgi:hypothetical protein
VTKNDIYGTLYTIIKGIIMWNDTQLAYLAGIIDGEGTIGIERQSPHETCRKKTYYTHRLLIVNTSNILKQWLQENFPCGKITYRKKIDGRKPCYVWRLFGKDAEDILQAIIPFIKIKRNQAECVLKFRQTKGKTGWTVSDEILKQRESLYQECKIYNAIGD